MKTAKQMASCKGTSPTKILRAVAGMIALLAVMASPGAGQVIAGPNGPVEFIGLQSWDAQELFDAIQEIDPDRPFHACAAVMRQQLGFADAAAILHLTNRSSDRYTIVVGVEDSTRVQYRPIGSETVVLPETWQNLKAVVGEDVRTLPAAARTLHSRGGFFNSVFNSARRLAERMGADPETLDQVWDLIDRMDGEEDRRLSHEVLAQDTSRSARAVATLLLGNFHDDDTSWHGLVGSLTDPNAVVSAVAVNMLDGLIDSKRRRPIEWSAARAPLLALFGGTHPSVFRGVLRVLVATDVDSEFGQQLVRERPDLLLAHVGAEHDRTREPALAFLRTLSGEDFGADIEAWTAWINGQSDGR